MAGTVNKVILIGYLGDEVKMHYFERGNSIGRFSIATDETYTNRQTGERITNTDWHNIVVRNKLAEICEQYLTKGDKVYIEGRLKNRQYVIDGQKRYMTEIQVQDMTFLSTKKELNSKVLPQIDKQNTKGKGKNTNQKLSSTNKEEDDSPF